MARFDDADRMRATFRPVRSDGFTLIEMMVVVAILVILALIALPGIPDKIVRDEIAEAVKLADLAKAPVAQGWTANKKMPLDNAEAGLPAAEKIVNNAIRSVAVESGAIQVTFGNRANAAIRGKVLTLRPAVVEDAPIVPVAWVCGHAEAPAMMTARGLDKTDVPLRFLPLNCRSGARAAASGAAATSPR